MPQLIAMIIIVVGAMIYMFQTFGGTGDKIEGIAQKTSIITEINNIKNGVQLALRSGSIHNTGLTADDPDDNKVKTLQGIAKLQYFPEQINNQLAGDDATENENTYKAISFGANSNMEITLVLPAKANANEFARPGLFVDLSKGNLATNTAFLEQQIIQDLGALAEIDRGATTTAYNTTLDAEGKLATHTALTEENKIDGKFTIYFKDLPRGMISAD